jgi:hypothetical protein
MAAIASSGAGGGNELFAEPAEALPLISQGAAVGAKAAAAGATHAAAAVPRTAAATPFDAAVEAAMIALLEQDTAATMTSATSATTHAAGADAAVASVVTEEAQSTQDLTRVGEQVTSSGLYPGVGRAMPPAASLASPASPMTQPLTPTPPHSAPPPQQQQSPVTAQHQQAPPASTSTASPRADSALPRSNPPTATLATTPGSAAPQPSPAATASFGGASTSGRAGVQMLGGPHGFPAPQAPGSPLPLDPPRPPVPQPPMPQPRPHDPRLRHLPPPSWTRPPLSEDSKKAQQQYKELIKDIEAHNSWRPDSGDPAAVTDYNSEANVLNTWKAQLEGQLNSWDTHYEPSSSPAEDANMPPSPAPAPPHSPHPRNEPQIRQETAGAPGQWNAELNHPQPNTEYIVNGGKYIFYTDENGLTRVIELNLNDPIPRGPRTSFDPPGMEPGDHAGHGVPRRLGGPGELINLTAQDAHANLSPVRIVENEWWRIYQATGHLNAEIEIVRDAVGRPLKYIYEWQDINGDWLVREIFN